MHRSLFVDIGKDCRTILAILLAGILTTPWGI
jgi:hypothetical protein